jgi:hypothetical protein
MKLLSEREQVRTVAKRWRDSYPDPEFRLRDGRIVGEIAARLDALDPETSTAGDVAAAMGNRGWVIQRPCDECGEYSWSCVELGEEPDYESCTATICEGCLRKALALIERERAAAEVNRLRTDFAEKVKRHIDAKTFSAEIVRGIDRNEVVGDWLAENVSATGADVTGTDPAHGRDWTAVVDTPKDGEP